MGDRRAILLPPSGDTDDHSLPWSRLGLLIRLLLLLPLAAVAPVNRVQEQGRAGATGAAGRGRSGAGVSASDVEVRELRPPSSTRSRPPPDGAARPCCRLARVSTVPGVNWGGLRAAPTCRHAGRRGGPVLRGRSPFHLLLVAALFVVMVSLGWIAERLVGRPLAGVLGPARPARAMASAWMPAAS